jgi:cytochrome c peroxidase
VRMAGVLLCVVVTATNAAPFEWRLPSGFPEPLVPADNPMSAEKVALGRRLFFEKHLSVTGEYSCASCHQPQHAYTDARARGVGALGDAVLRSTPSLANVAYLPAYTWADPRIKTLEAQMRTPLFGTHPIEMGLAGHESTVLAALQRDDSYDALFAAAFPGKTRAVSIENVIKAIAAFERTLISARSAFDRYLYDDDRAALSDNAQRGLKLFFSPRLGCAECHSGPNFSGAISHTGQPAAKAFFANTGLYNLDGRGAYPKADSGLTAVTHHPQDDGKFRVPTLRNVAMTAPYMHDGSLATLEDVLDHYAMGGKGIPRGATRQNHLRDPRIHPFDLNAAERADLIAFLYSLTDEEFVRDSATH